MADEDIGVHIRFLNSTLSHKHDAEYEELSTRYLKALVDRGVSFQSPGPGSPMRWIVHGVEHKLAPHIAVPPSYRFDRIGDVANAALSELAALFSRRLPAFAAELEAARKRRAHCFGLRLRPNKERSRSKGRDALIVSDETGARVWSCREALPWPEEPFEDVADVMDALLADQNILTKMMVGGAAPNWVIAMNMPLQESPLAAFPFARQDDGAWFLEGRRNVYVLHVPSMGVKADQGASMAVKYWQDWLARQSPP